MYGYNKGMFGAPLAALAHPERLSRLQAKRARRLNRKAPAVPLRVRVNAEERRRPQACCVSC